MASLADQLAADFDSDEGEELEPKVEPEKGKDVDPQPMDGLESHPDIKAEASRGGSPLWESGRFRNVFDRVKKAMAGGPRTAPVVGMVETDPEYKLIVEASNLSKEIDDEIERLARGVRDVYTARFPELETLVTGSLDYIRTVQVLQNDISGINTELGTILPSAVVMVVTTSASTTAGAKLEPDVLADVLAQCQAALDLDAARELILEFSESRMGLFAPSLAALLGPNVAARLMGRAGGLAQLSQLPADVIQILGVVKKNSLGLSSRNIERAGYLAETQLVSKAPLSLQLRTARLVATKAALAARMDAFSESPSPAMGLKLHEEIASKVEKWKTPGQGRSVKALPVPEPTKRKKRGGRRARRLKEKLGATELSKARNRMQFGVPEPTISYGEDEIGLGMIGAEGSGKVRTKAVDTQRLSAAAAHRLERKLKGHRSNGTSVPGTLTSLGSMTAGTSSLAFTPVQGIQLANPSAARATSGTESVYFRQGSGFKVPAAKK